LKFDIQREQCPWSRDHLDRAKERRLHMRKEHQFDREVLSRLEGAISRTKAAVKDLGSAWSEFVWDAIFRNIPPDFEYVDLGDAFHDIERLQWALTASDGPLCNLNEVRSRFQHYPLVVSGPCECGSFAPRTLDRMWGEDTSRRHIRDPDEGDTRDRNEEDTGGSNSDS
jgi:hypothetical protein